MWCRLQHKDMEIYADTNLSFWNGEEEEGGTGRKNWKERGDDEMLKEERNSCHIQKLFNVYNRIHRDTPQLLKMEIHRIL